MQTKCPNCPHGLGFKCRQCWPAPIEQFEAHVNAGTPAAVVIRPAAAPNPGAIAMQTPAITLTLEPSAQFLRDVLCTAVEGGSNYWARFKVLNRVQGEHVEEYDRVRVMEYGDDDKAQSQHDIGLPELAEGLRRALAGNMGTGADHENVAASYRADLFAALISEPGGDAANVDANLADIVLQAAALGCIVYG